MADDWNWWTQETKKEQLMKQLIEYAVILERLPTAQEMNENPHVKSAYEYSVEFGSFGVALRIAAGLLYDNAKVRSPRELTSTQEFLSTDQQELLLKQQYLKYQRRLAELRKPGALRKHMRGYQKLLPLAKETENVVKIPIRRRLRLEEYKRGWVTPTIKPQKQSESGVPQRAGRTIRKSVLSQSESESRSKVALNTEKAELGVQIAQQVVTAIAEKAIEAAMTELDFVKEDQNMAKPFVTEEQALKALQRAYKRYGAVPTLKQYDDFARAYSLPLSTTIVKRLGGTSEWPKLLGLVPQDEVAETSAEMTLAAAETDGLAAEPAQDTGESVIVVPECVDATTEEPAQGVQAPVAETVDEVNLVTMKLSGELEIDLQLHGQKYRVQVQMG